MLKKMFLPIMLLLCVTGTAQTTTTPDKHVVAMQRMMMKLITAAAGNFANIKGTEESKQGNAVFYKANLTATVTDAAEMKEALATDFFGAMQTADDHIVVTPEGTIYLARYTDDAEFSITEMVTQAFTSLPAYAGKADANSKVEKIQGATIDEAVYMLTVDNSVVGKLNCNTKAGTAALIIGIKK
jgi:hypothetical protein